MAPQEVPLYATWANNTNPVWYKDAGLRKCSLYCTLLFFGMFTGGYDGSYLAGLQALDTWNSYFGYPAGNLLGLISASAYFPCIVVSPFVPYVTDKWGRKAVIFFAAVLCIAGAIIGCFAQNVGMMIAGRVVVGISSGFLTNGTVCLISELQHPRLRGITSCLYLTAYYVGSIVAAWTTFGMVYWPSSSWSWRIPTLLQALGPAILIVSVLFIVPESPRWLIANGRDDQAREILERLHANGSTDDELVINEIEEINTALKLEEANGNGSWRSLVATQGNRRRTVVLLLIGSGSQLMGNGLVTYYLAPILRSVGITSSVQIAGINGGLSVYNLVLGVAGGLNVDRVGRRPLWLVSTFGCLIAFVFITALSATYANSSSPPVGSAVIAFLFIFYGLYDVGWTPLAFGYSVEILPFQIRAKGMCLMATTQSVALTFNQWVNPVALEAIAWKYYLVYVFVIAFYLVCAFYLFPETRGYTSEEVGLLFDQKTGEEGIIEQLGTGEKGNKTKDVHLEHVAA